jgi:hypothetical protein
MFKVGDRVRFVRQGVPPFEECGTRWVVDWAAGCKLELGKIYTVTAITDSAVQVDNKCIWLDPWHFTLVEENAMFKVEDKVRFVRQGVPPFEECGTRWYVDWAADCGLKLGKIYTVTAITDGAVQVDDIGTWLDPWHFKLVDGLRGVKVGDWIATIQRGWVKVTKITDSSYPIMAGSISYTEDGLYSMNNKAPSAFINPPDWLRRYIGPKPVSLSLMR